jgi:ankyrin repeat/BTB/POZ domain-containing protein 1
MMDENGELNSGAVRAISNASVAVDEAIYVNAPEADPSKTKTVSMDLASNPFMNGEIRTLDGEIAGDEFAADAINYQVLLGKIDSLLERLKLDA